jgi:hypothetical protein
MIYVFKSVALSLFLNHFVDIYQPAPIPSNRPSPFSGDGMFDYSLMFIQDHLVYDMLNKLLSKCNTTPDNIPSIVLKRCASSLTSPIAKILRRSFFFVPLLYHFLKPVILLSPPIIDPSVLLVI